MNSSAIEHLVTALIGPVPSPRKAAVRGTLSGGTFFFLFEYFSVINSNVPRVPVCWLLMAAVIMIESVLFFRVARLLRQPRRNDLFFIFRLDYQMRTIVAGRATRHAHQAFIPFVATAGVIAALLEFFLIHERSFLLLILPLAVLVAMAIMEILYSTIITRHGIPCIRGDHIDDEAMTNRSGFFRTYFTQQSIWVAQKLASMVPPTLRIVVMRNFLYFLRGEILLTILIIIAAPVLCIPLLLLLHNPLSPFVTLFPLVGMFMMLAHLTSDLGEAVENLPRCHWYHITPRQVLGGSFITLALPVLPLVITVIVMIAPTLVTLYGVVRLLNFLIAVGATIFIGCRACIAVRNKDTEPAIGLAEFGVVCVGNFVPWAGALFSAAAVAGIVLLDWEILMKRR